MNLESHVKNVRCSCFQHIKWISDIHKYITDNAAKQLVHAFVTSRLDNVNSLLYGLPSSVIHKLQMVQHAAARVITRTRKFDSITPVLKELHWLPVHKRIIFKLLVLTHGSGAFLVAGPALWNELPNAIKCAETLSSFKSQLKNISSAKLLMLDLKLWKNIIHKHIPSSSSYTGHIFQREN